MNTIRIVLTGGGSGGHIYPLLAVADALKTQANPKDISLELSYIGPAHDYIEQFVSRGIRVKTIMSGKLRRYFSLLNIIDVPRFCFGFVQALFHMLILMPDVVFSKGGTAAPTAVTLVAWLYRIPVVIHESDIFPGLGNAISSRFAKRILVSFEATVQHFDASRTAVTGQPVRPDVLAGRPSQAEGKRAFGFNLNEPVLLVLGGSQGSQRISERVVECLPELLRVTQVLHQTGKLLYKEISELAHLALDNLPPQEKTKVRYEAAPYFEDNMAVALAAADLVVARAGSGTIFELAAFGKPAVLIPLQESARNHQSGNAYEFAKSGAAVVIEEGNLLTKIFLDQIQELIADKNRLEQMANAAADFYKPAAAQNIAEEILRVGTSSSQ